MTTVNNFNYAAPGAQDVQGTHIHGPGRPRRTLLAGGRAAPGTLAGGRAAPEGAGNPVRVGPRRPRGGRESRP